MEAFFFFKADLIQVLLRAMQNRVGRPSGPKGSGMADLTAVSLLLGGGDGAELRHPVQKQSLERWPKPGKRWSSRGEIRSLAALTNLALREGRC